MTIELWPFLVLPLGGLVTGLCVARFVIGRDWTDLLRGHRQVQRR